MGKLHELLAVEADLDGAHRKILLETATTFTKKADHFQGFHRSTHMLREDGIDYPETIKAIDTTVDAKLDYMSKTEIRYFDALLQKEATNQVAMADLIIDGVTIAKNLPATYLLGMESRLKSLRGVYDAIPTLAPGLTWDEDTQKGKGVFVSRYDDKKLKTETVVEPVVFYEATKEHPAQVKESSKTNTVGTIITKHWSGMITPAHKSALLGKVDKLIRGMKQARQRANSTEIIKSTVGKELFDFINS